MSDTQQSAKQPQQLSAHELKQLAEKVYRLMLADLRMEQARTGQSARRIKR
jgi:hypothetical protein